MMDFKAARKRRFLFDHNRSVCYHDSAIVGVTMAQILVREVDEETKLRLQRRAKRHGRSMEAEIRDILRDAVKATEKPSTGMGTDIANLFAGIGFRPGEEIKEWKGFELKSPFEP
jgi:antitoxin FitA